MPQKTKLSQRKTPKRICNHCGLQVLREKPDSLNYCPECGRPTIAWQKDISNYFKRIPLSRDFAKAVTQFQKNEYESAARTALIILEENVKEMTGIDSSGVDLFAKAFSVKKEGNKIIERPKIAINDLENESDFNEHDGVKLFSMGLMKGMRNAIAHTNKNIHPKLCLSILCTCDFVLELIRHGSVKKERKGKWIKGKNKSETGPK